jgi:hypothetical protein
MTMAVAMSINAVSPVFIVAVSSLDCGFAKTEGILRAIPLAPVVSSFPRKQMVDQEGIIFLTHCFYEMFRLLRSPFFCSNPRRICKIFNKITHKRKKYCFYGSAEEQGFRDLTRPV